MLQQHHSPRTISQANFFRATKDTETSACHDDLLFIEEQLYPALAALIFIHTAKRALRMPIEVPLVENKILDTIEAQTATLNLIPNTFRAFILNYFMVSKAIQRHWYEQGDNFNYSFSEHEVKALELLQTAIPTLNSKMTLDEIRDVLRRNKKLAGEVLDWGRNILNQTRTDMLSKIKEALNNKGLLDVGLIKRRLSTMFNQVFSQKDIIDKKLLDAWAESLSDCSKQLYSHPRSKL